MDASDALHVHMQYGEVILCADGSEAAELMDKDDPVHDMDAVSPRSHEDNLPVSQQRVLKFELQLYKLKDSQYLLDVQASLTNCRALPDHATLWCIIWCCHLITVLVLTLSCIIAGLESCFIRFDNNVTCLGLVNVNLAECMPIM